MATNNMIKWVKTNSVYFESLENKDPNTMYLLTDTQEIYNGDKNYTSDVYYIETFPDDPIKGKIYVKTSTMECKSWNGNRWVTIVPRVYGELQDGVACDGLVTGDAIKAYVSDKLSDNMLNGASDTDHITLARALTIKGQTLGSYKDGDIIQKGELLTSVLSKMLAKRIPATYTAPRIGIFPSSQTLEAGSFVAPTISASYTQNDAGNLVNFKIMRSINGASSVLLDKGIMESLKIDQFQVTEEENVQFTTRVTYADGPIKLDNLGEQSPEGRIMSGSISATMGYTPKRKLFYGSLSSAKDLNSANIRALSNNKLNPVNRDNFNVSVPVGTSQIIIAYPASLPDIANITSSALNLNVLDTFSKTTVQVEGANGYKAVAYKVYEYRPSIPFGSSDTYKVTIG